MFDGRVEHVEVPARMVLHCVDDGGVGVYTSEKREEEEEEEGEQESVDDEVKQQVANRE